MVKWTSARVSRVFDRLLGPRAELQELTYILYALIWGFILFFAPDALETSVIYIHMAKMANQYMWGGLLFLYGLLGLWGYALSDQKIRRLSAMMGVLLWTLVSYFLFRDFRPTVGLVAVPLCAVMSILTYIRLGTRE